MNWIELHTNTRYSDVLSFIGPQQIISACARNNCRAVAITDRNTVQEYLTAEQAAKKNGIALCKFRSMKSTCTEFPVHLHG